MATSSRSSTSSSGPSYPTTPAAAAPTPTSSSISGPTSRDKEKGKRKRAKVEESVLSLLPFSLSLHRVRRRGDVDPCVDVRRTAEVPHERRSFQPPDVPHPVVPQVFLLVERQAQLLHAARGLHLPQRLLHI